MEMDKRELRAQGKEISWVQDQAYLLNKISVHFMDTAWKNEQCFPYVDGLPDWHLRREILRLRVGLNPLCKQWGEKLHDGQ